MKSLIEMRDIHTNNPEHIIVHHTGGTDRDPKADTSHHTFESIQSWHINGRGWDNIGYHYVIEKNGRVVAGRPENYHGAHAVSRNRNSVGIVLAGNFDATKPTKAQESALGKLLVEVMEWHNIPLENIAPHRSVANKTCYGTLLGDDWARNLAKKYLEKGSSVSLADATLSQLVTELINRLKKK